MSSPRELLVDKGRVLLQACSLYKGHMAAVIERHHVCPVSWWVAAGRAVDTPVVAVCPTCHYDIHAAIDGLIAGRDVSAIPRRCVTLARQALAMAAERGLTPARTL